VRCALCWNTETAELSRRHNNANVLSIGERMVSFEIVLDIARIFLSTEFEGDRHVKRLGEVSHYEETGKLPA
jgi:ribose 5-phosphate isomerase B